MTPIDIIEERLLRQRIGGEGLERPEDVVRWMGAVQAQDYPAAKWALGLRTRLCTDQDVEDAFTGGRLLRTHVMRPTWHFVAPEDIRWMQMLTAPRVSAIFASQYRQLEIDESFLKGSRKVILRALRDGRQMTRTELGAELRKAGIDASGVRLAHVLSRLELDAVVCSGGRRGKQFTYALLEERAPAAVALKREEALGRLTERYFTSHGPATARDLAWWSGLSAADARAGIETVKSNLVSETIEGRTYWFTSLRPKPRRNRPTLQLLPNYDEYIVGYTDRSAIFDDVHARHLDARHNPLFNHTIASRGRITGTWKRTVGRESVSVASSFFLAPTAAEEKRFVSAARAYADFLGLSLEPK